MSHIATTPRDDGRRVAASTHDPERRLVMRPGLLIAVVLFVLSLGINLAHIDTTPFHTDETRWINRAHYFPDLLDPFGPTWDDQYLTRGQPPLGSYLMGLGLLLQGRDTDTNAVWDYAYGTEWNTINGAMASQTDLHAARRINTVVGAITVVLVFAIATSLTGRVAGTAAGLLLALHPLHIRIASQALSDQLLIMLAAMATLALIRLADRPGRGRALLVGILLGLGGAAKLSPLLLAIPLALYGVALLALARTGYVHRDKARSLGPLLIIQPLVALATFVISYPYLWPKPIRRSWNLFALRAQEMEEQSAAWPGTTVANPLDALYHIYDRLTWQFSTTGNIMETAAGWLGLSVSIPGIDLLLAVIGIGILAWLVVRRGLTSGAALAAFLLAGQTGTIVVGMRVDFYRYHLPIVLVSSILGGLTLQLVWQYAAERGAWNIWNLIPGITVVPTRSREVTSTREPESPSAAGSHEGATRSTRTGTR